MWALAAVGAPVLGYQNYINNNGAKHVNGNEGGITGSRRLGTYMNHPFNEDKDLGCNSSEDEKTLKQLDAFVDKAREKVEEADKTYKAASKVYHNAYLNCKEKKKAFKVYKNALEACIDAESKLDKDKADRTKLRNNPIHRFRI